MVYLRSTCDLHTVNTNPVILDVTKLGSQKIDLLFSWVELWLRQHCKSPWSVDLLEEKKPSSAKARIIICVKFSDVREALYFKLGPMYLSYHN